MKVAKLLLVLMLFVAAALSMRADTFNALTLTASGANTTFTIAGTYPADFATTPYGSPDAPLALTFTLPTIPTNMAFVDDADGIFAVDTTVTLNGLTFPESQIAFFDATLSGGLDVCLSEGSNPDPPTKFNRFVIAGDQLYSGSVSNPVFVSGTATIDQNQSFIEALVPEPASLTLAGAGIGLATLLLYRRKRKLIISAEREKTIHLVPAIIRILALALLCFAVLPGRAQTIPKTWDEAAMESGILKPPVAGAKVTRVPAEYYYRMQERVVYRQYPVYASKSEPSGYLAKLAVADPEIIFDPARLRTEQDWIRAGRDVFRSPIALFPIAMLPHFRGILERTSAPTAADGTYPELSIVVPQKGTVMVGLFSCAMCHTRIQPDSSAIEGGPGNAPDLLLGFPPNVEAARAFQRSLFHVPWIDKDPIDQVQNMSIDEINAIKAAIPLGVLARHGTSLFTPAQTPDLIGIKDLKYLDHTGLMRNRNAEDLMRYAALNQGLDMVSDYAGYRPTAFMLASGFKDNNLPAPETDKRYSDTQLLALTKFLYSLTPPPNPNHSNALSQRGEKVFAREGCNRCHTAPLYTSNKLTPARGFVVTDQHLKTYDIEPTVVGTDPELTMRTRRGTGYYKIPSLRGVWYRGPFEHSGSVATLEDWFDPRRLQSDYVPTGFKGFGVKTRAVPGHPFGLGLSADDKGALIAFLKTL